MSKKKQVLVVDDSDSILHMMRDVLSGIGFEIVTAKDGREAAKIYTEKKKERIRFSLIITDVHMPNVDGLQLIKKLRQVDKFVPILMMTTDGTNKTISEGKKLGASGWAHKPVNRDKLVATIKKLVEVNT